MKDKRSLIILGIETSCDETAAAVLEYKNGKFKIILNLISSQISIHRKYGGIIPEIAARAHIKNMPLIIKRISQKINLKKIDLIAVTRGPGLVTSLLVGVETAKTLSYLLKKPLIGVNHLEGHLYANWLPPINVNPKSEIRNPKHIFPAISLIVSGGHTELGLIKKLGRYKRIGQTRDDAAGECFDKIARLLGLGYPGGPVVAKMADEIKNKTLTGKLPRPMINSDDFDFSFSGLKTAVLYLVKKNKKKMRNKEFVKNVCAEAQQAIIDVLINKTVRVTKKYRAKTVFLSGGVAANRELREQLRDSVGKLSPQRNFLVPPNNLCTDNAAMIAAAGIIKYGMLSQKQKKKLDNNWKSLAVNPNLSL